MDKYTKAVLAVVTLSLCTMPVKADDKVWYCTIEHHYILAIDLGIKSMGSDRFSVKVSPQQLQFGDEGPSPSTSFPMIEYNSPIDWIAGIESIFLFKFRDGNMSFSTQNESQIMMYLATCENF